jgi:hypothetical protein
MEIMTELAGDWEYTGVLTPETRMYADMDMKSLDFVTLSAALVNRFGRIPFDELYTQLAEQPPETREITIREYVAFVYRHLPQAAVSG